MDGKYFYRRGLETNSSIEGDSQEHFINQKGFQALDSNSQQIHYSNVHSCRPIETVASGPDDFR